MTGLTWLWVLVSILTWTGKALAQPIELELTKAAASHAELLEHFQRPIIDYTVTTYGSREGAPPSVTSVAQTPDGFLWLATPEGLFRFDGALFVHQDAVPGSVSTVTSDNQGGLWLAHPLGGAGRLFQGKYEDHSAGLPQHAINRLVVDAAGIVWAESTVGPYKFENGKWTPVGIADGISGTPRVGQIGKLKDGSIWITLNVWSDEAWIKSASAHTFHAINKAALWREVFGASADEIPPTTQKMLEEAFTVPLQTFVQDPAGATWYLNNGLSRVRWTAVANRKQFTDESLAHFNPALADGLTCITTDREGNVWIGDNDGVVRVSANKLTAIAPPGQMIAPLLAKGPRGDVWIAADEDIYHADAGTISAWRHRDESVSAIFISAIFVDRSQRLWIFHYDKSKDTGRESPGFIERIDSTNKVEKIDYPAGLSRTPVAFAQLSGDSYLMGTPFGVYRYANQWLPATGFPNRGALTITDDGFENTWLTYANGDVAAFKHGKQTLYSAKNIALGAVYALDLKPQHVWLSGDSGIGFLTGDRVTPLWKTEGNPFVGSRGVLEMTDGELWVNATSGVYRISPQGVSRLMSGSPPRPSEMEVFRQEDGLLGTVATNLRGGLIEGGDGKIWVSRLDGASWLDPRHILRNPVPAQAVVDTVEIDGRKVTVDGDIDIPPRTHRLRINFTATSLSHPDHVSFRYQLEGIDKDWQEATTHRFADYSDPAPGAHLFKVVGYNEDGASSGVPAVIKLTIKPTIYQTWWFRILCVFAVAIALIIAFQARMRLGREKLRLVLETKHEERDRIARELHDTLMQSMQGMTLQIQTWSQDGNDERHQEMQRAAESATTALQEGRQRILALRAASDSAPSLLTELRKTAEHFALRYPLVFDLGETGEPTELQPTSCKEILEIAREAIRNAATHADANAISVLLDYGIQALTLTVNDDGNGFPRRVLEAGTMPGHWGLVGMKERACALGAQLSLGNRPQGGAEVKLVVPSSLAYEKTPSRHWWRRKPTTGFPV